MWLSLAVADQGILDQLGINLKVVAVQAAVFLFTLWILYRFLFRPVTEFTKRREQEIEDAGKDVEKNRAEVERLSADYRRRLEEIEKQAYDRLQKAIREGQAAKAEIVSKAQEEAHREMESARAAIEKEKVQAREALRAEVKRLALEAAERMTARALEPGRHEGIVDEILSQETQ